MPYRKTASDDPALNTLAYGIDATPKSRAASRTVYRYIGPPLIRITALYQDMMAHGPEIRARGAESFCKRLREVG